MIVLGLWITSPICTKIIRTSLSMVWQIWQIRQDRPSKRLINDGKITSYKVTHIITTLEEKNSTIVVTNIGEIDGYKFSQKFSIVAWSVLGLIEKKNCVIVFFNIVSSNFCEYWNDEIRTAALSKIDHFHIKYNRSKKLVLESMVWFVSVKETKCYEVNSIVRLSLGLFRRPIRFLSAWFTPFH